MSLAELRVFYDAVLTGALRISCADQQVSFALPDDDQSAAVRVQKDHVDPVVEYNK